MHTQKKSFVPANDEFVDVSMVSLAYVVLVVVDIVLTKSSANALSHITIHAPSPFA